MKPRAILPWRAARLWMTAMLITLALLVASVAPVAALHVQPTPVQPLPDRALISGVPFLSYAEAARLPYPNKEILHPSFPAAEAMVLKYWGLDANLVTNPLFPENLKTWTRIDAEAKDLDEIKPFIARGIPVIVLPAATPDAHFLNPAIAAIMVIEAQSKKLRLEDLDRNNGSTGILGRMTAFEMFPRIKAEYRWPVDPISESALVHVRILIGYDDVKRTVSLHDPSLGPRREISYDDFTKMWKAFGNGYIAAYPNDYLSRPAKRSASPAYRSPTTDEQAAAYFLQGYALSSIGKPAAAEEQFRRGLALPGLGKGYRHLFLLELASALYSRAHIDEAVSAAEQAITLLPESSMAWSFLGRVYPQSSVNDAKKKGKDAARKAQMLAGSRSALKTVAAALPRDFFIPYLGEVRGWAGETLRLP